MSLFFGFACNGEVGLARLLVSDARLWLADEPLAALDPARAEQCLAALRRNAGERGAALVCSLHQVAVARERFARIVALRNGECVYDGPSAGLTDEALRVLYGGVDLASTPVPVPPPSPGSALPETMCR